MPVFRVEVYGRAREVYVVDAADAKEAREVWIDYDPIVSEVVDTEINFVEEVADED